MGLTGRLLDLFLPSRSTVVPAPLPLIDTYWPYASIGGNAYPLTGLTQTLKGHVEEIDDSFTGLVQQAYRTNAVVFACELARMQLFSEARFQFQRMRGGRPAELFGDSSLDVLEHPWPTAITGDLLTRALLDADIGGTAFNARRTRTTIRRLRPDWVTMILGSESDEAIEAGDIDADVLGVVFHPGGRSSGRKPEFLLRSDISIFAPIPDPLASFRGMPWVLPVISEILADKQMTAHKSAYLVNGATPNLTVAIDKDLKEAADPKAFAEWVEAFKKTNPSANQWEKYKTWYLAGGTIVTKVGSNMQEIDFKSVQGAGETRIAAAAGVPPVIVGLSEGLQAATYSNYGQARRRFADNTMRPLWRNMAGSLETIVPPPSGTRLWYDDRDIQALAEDKKDLAEVHQLQAQQIRTLIDTGFKADAVIAAVNSGDFTTLKGEHTGLFSVQLQAPGSTKMPTGEAPGEAPVGSGTAPEKVVPVAKPARSIEDMIVESETRTYRAMELLRGPTVVFEDGAIRNESPVTVTVPEQPAPVVNVTLPEQPAPSVTFEDGAITTTVEAPPAAQVTVNVPEQPAPIVTVEAPPPAEVNVTVEAPPPAEVTVTVEAPPAANVTVPEPRSVRKKVERNAKGEITALIEEVD